MPTSFSSSLILVFPLVPPCSSDRFSLPSLLLHPLYFLLCLLSSVFLILHLFQAYIAPILFSSSFTIFLVPQSFPLILQCLSYMHTFFSIFSPHSSCASFLFFFFSGSHFQSCSKPTTFPRSVTLDLSSHSSLPTTLKMRKVMLREAKNLTFPSTVHTVTPRRQRVMVVVVVW